MTILLIEKLCFVWYLHSFCSLQIDEEKMRGALSPEMLATDIAYYLVRKGVSSKIWNMPVLQLCFLIWLQPYSQRRLRYIFYTLNTLKMQWCKKKKTQLYSVFRSPESLGWPIEMSWCPEFVNILFSRTTGPNFTKFVYSIWYLMLRW